ncbi:MAG: acetyl-CoA carboxylase biotin carboxylase subunit [Bacteroidetes bacterium]|nr:acetyl-CoA carboxylase biotin carboxylase subunit [Bacteroidota bacterium]
MFKKILIANRGEIAVRIISTAKEMGIKTVAVYSDFDRYSLFTKLADEAFHLGESPSSKSYLLADKIIDIAKKTGAEAIHPGYGFLSERGFFAKMCEDNGIKFIGPGYKAIDILGSKTDAKGLALKNNVPVVPGTDKPLQDMNKIKSIAADIGYPVLIKASAGGGGKGMRVVNEEADIESSLRMAQSEAKSSFGDDSVFIEKYIVNPRHIEFQILADEHGNVIHLGERECSMQRRHQKIIEETPSVIMDENLRNEMGECAKRIVKAAGYSNAGTVEFIVDENKKFYFLEVNTRLQVEHPITEIRTGLDLVREQLKIASGEKLSRSQEDIKFSGHTIECRICAEDSDDNFMPSTGKITYLKKFLGSGMREDTGIEQDDEISIYYDPMVSKLISFGADREIAIDKMKRALKEYKIVGIKTNIGFLLSLLECGEFIDGNYHTQFIEKVFQKRDNKIKSSDSDLNAAVCLASVLLKEKKSSMNGKIKFQLNGKAGSWVKQRQESYR